MMQQNGVKRDDARGRVARVSETGIKIEGTENWLSFSETEYRQQTLSLILI
mgnify:CR=1 FL=1